MGSRGAILSKRLQLPAVLYFYQDREVILQNVFKRTIEARRELRLWFWLTELTSTPNDQFLSGDLPGTSSVAGMLTWTTVLWGTSVEMATVGFVQPWPMGLVPGRLMLTTSNLIPRLSTRRTARMLVGTVSPSAYLSRCGADLLLGRIATATRWQLDTELLYS